MNSRIEEERLRLYELCRRAALELYGFCPQFTVNRPRDGKNGDFAASVALALGGALRSRPSEIAARIVRRLDLEEGETAEPASKGFINFYLRPGFLLSVLGPVRELEYIPLPAVEDPNFGAVYPYHRLRSLLEFQGHKPDGREDLELLTSPGDVRLLWALAGDGEDIAPAALELYDREGLAPDFPPLAQARYVLFNNALYRLAGTRKERL